MRLGEAGWCGVARCEARLFYCVQKLQCWCLWVMCVYILVDVTLARDDEQIQAHEVVCIVLSEWHQFILI